MARIATILSACTIAIVLAGCQNPADPDGWTAKWDRAARGDYDGPALASYDPAPPQTPQVGGYHPHMYVGYSTVNNVMGAHRDDSLAGTFRFPASYGYRGGVGYNPTVRQFHNGTGLGVRSTIVPPRRP